MQHEVGERGDRSSVQPGGQALPGANAIPATSFLYLKPHTSRDEGAQQMIALQEAQAAAPTTMRLHFASGMPGLEEYHRYTLLALEDSPAYWLECDDEPGISLPVADAFAVVSDYSFELGAGDVRALGLTDERDALVLVVLTLPHDGSAITANLLAPIVANRHTGAARQVILEGSGHSLRHELTIKDEG